MITESGRLELTWFDHERHTSQVLWTLEECYPHETWTERDLLRFIQHRTSTNIIKVLVDSRDIVHGVIMYSLARKQRSLCRIRRVAVRQRYRRCGLASYMLNALCGRRSLLNRRNKFLCRVHERDLAAQRLLQSMGFTFNALAPREKDENGEDYYEFVFLRKAAETLLRKPQTIRA